MPINSIKIPLININNRCTALAYKMLAGEIFGEKCSMFKSTSVIKNNNNAKNNTFYIK